MLTVCGEAGCQIAERLRKIGVRFANEDFFMDAPPFLVRYGGKKGNKALQHSLARESPAFYKVWIAAPVPEGSVSSCLQQSP